MEDILASIKRIIAEDGDERPAPRHDPSPSADPVEDEAAEDILELTDPVANRSDEVIAVPPEPGQAPAPEEADPHADDVPDEPQTHEEPLLSDDSAEASRAALAMLSSFAGNAASPAGAMKPEALEALTREMLRPMLKEWLDENLPALVERLVAREISRLSGDQG